MSGAYITINSFSPYPYNSGLFPRQLLPYIEFKTWVKSSKLDTVHVLLCLFLNREKST